MCNLQKSLCTVLLLALFASGVDAGIFGIKWKTFWCLGINRLFKRCTKSKEPLESDPLLPNKPQTLESSKRRSCDSRSARTPSFSQSNPPSLTGHGNALRSKSARTAKRMSASSSPPKPRVDGTPARRLPRSRRRKSSSNAEGNVRPSKLQTVTSTVSVPKASTSERDSKNMKSSLQIREPAVAVGQIRPKVKSPAKKTAKPKFKPKYATKEHPLVKALQNNVKLITDTAWSNALKDKIQKDEIFVVQSGNRKYVLKIAELDQRTARTEMKAFEKIDSTGNLPELTNILSGAIVRDSEVDIIRHLVGSSRINDWKRKDVPFLILPYVGQNPYDWALRYCGKDRDHNLKTFLSICQQVLNGLNSLHKIGIVHKDFKEDQFSIQSTSEGGVQCTVYDYNCAGFKDKMGKEAWDKAVLGDYSAFFRLIGRICALISRYDSKGDWFVSVEAAKTLIEYKPILKNLNEGTWTVEQLHKSFLNWFDLLKDSISTFAPEKSKDDRVLADLTCSNMIRYITKHCRNPKFA